MTYFAGKATEAAMQAAVTNRHRDCRIICTKCSSVAPARPVRGEVAS
jgi:hypothetical protein